MMGLRSCQARRMGCSALWLEQMAPTEATNSMWQPKKKLLSLSLQQFCGPILIITSSETQRDLGLHKRQQGSFQITYELEQDSN